MFDKTLNPPMSFNYELPCWRSKQINVQSHFRKVDNEVRWKSSVSILNAFCLFFVFQHWVWTSCFLLGLLLPQEVNQKYFRIVYHIRYFSSNFRNFPRKYCNWFRFRISVFIYSLTHVCACWIWQFPFCTPWKHQKTSDIFIFSGGIEGKHLPKMG